MKRIAMLAAGATILVGLSACRLAVVGHGHRAHLGVAVKIPVGHVHSDHCGHYQYRGAWYHHNGHVHGHGCGHQFVKGVWIIKD